MSGFDAKQARHLDKLPPVKNALLWGSIDSKPLMELPPDRQRDFDNIAYLRNRYGWMPRKAALALRKLVKYNGSNPLYRVGQKITRGAFALDLRDSEKLTMIRPGLAAAAERNRMRRIADQDGNATSYDSGIGYANEDHDLAIALRYQAWHRASMRFETEQEQLGDHFYYAITNTTKFLKLNPYIKRFINFGACYGIVDHRLAERNPGVQFYGVDRAPAIKKFNDNLFKAPNLEFVAADIGEVIKKLRPLDDTAFFFQRTMIIFPEAFVTRLFDSLRGVAAIIGIEPYRYLIPERRFYKMSTNYQPSAYQDGIQFMHNYPWLCAQAGVRMIEERWAKNADEAAKQTYCFIAARP